MNLFVFRPEGFGLDSYFVMEENEEAARESVKEHYARENNTDDHAQWGGIDCDDPKYNVEVYELGEVATNDNA